MPRDLDALTDDERRVVLMTLLAASLRLRAQSRVWGDARDAIGRRIQRVATEEVALLESAIAKLGAKPAPGREGERDGA